VTSGINLMDEQEALDSALTYVRSHDWWCLPVLNAEAAGFVQEIETRFYSGEANADFHLMMGGSDIMFFAHKRRMSGDQLADFCEEILRTENEAALAAIRTEKQDILLFDVEAATS
jgi:hypothetical protein